MASTDQVAVAGVGSTLPTPSDARTENVWLPSVSAVRSAGDVHAAKAPASSLHSKVAGAPVAVKAIESAVVEMVAGIVVVMLVSGAVVSTVKGRDPGALVFPAASVAVT